jgi:hypothetical protein
MRILFYPLIFCVLYKQIKTYLDNKRKLTDIFYSINHINKKLKKIESLIHKKSVNFNDTVEDIPYNILDVDENSYSSEEY